jgi:hypothetical protein
LTENSFDPNTKKRRKKKGESPQTALDKKNDNAWQRAGGQPTSTNQLTADNQFNTFQSEMNH